MCHHCDRHSRTNPFSDENADPFSLPVEGEYWETKLEDWVGTVMLTWEIQNGCDRQGEVPEDFPTGEQRGSNCALNQLSWEQRV